MCNLTPEQRAQRVKDIARLQRRLDVALERRRRNGGHEDSPGEVTELRVAIRHLAPSVRED